MVKKNTIKKITESSSTANLSELSWLELDGALLGFDRDSGRNVLLRGDSTADFVQKAPRVVQLSLTNACNKTCGFCYRPLESKSRWTLDSTIELARYLDDWGVLELALGGGEPTVFPRFPELVKTLFDETGLAINFTTNGTRLTDALLEQLTGVVGQIQVSVYDDENLDDMIQRLVAHEMRFGLNYLVTPTRLRTLDAELLRWADMGVHDVLLLSYKGREDLHLSPSQLDDLDQRIVVLHQRLRGRLQLKVDVCWSNRLKTAPQMFFDKDCRAGGLFMSITSDRRVLSCSFASGGVAFEQLDELPGIYRQLKSARIAADTPGCTRLTDHGKTLLPLFHPSTSSPPASTPSRLFPEAM